MVFSGVVVSGEGVGSESVGSGCVGAVAEDSDVVVALSAGKQLDAIFFSFLLRSRDRIVCNRYAPGFPHGGYRFCLNSLGNHLNYLIHRFSVRKLHLPEGKRLAQYSSQASGFYRIGVIVGMVCTGNPAVFKAQSRVLRRNRSHNVSVCVNII